MKAKVYLDRNESQFPLSPACRGIIKSKYQKYLLRYTDKSIDSVQNKLLEKLQNLTGIDKTNIALGDGCEEILKICFDHFIKKGDKVLLADKSWGHYKTLIEAAGGAPVYFNLAENRDRYRYDIASFKKNYKKYSPKIVIITSPNNPTGNSIQFKLLCDFIKTAKKSIFILDQAYWGFEDENKNQLKKILTMHNKILITRSFSKYLGMPGIRLGYCIAGDYFKSVKESLNPYLGFNQLSILLGLSALNDLSYYKKIAKIISDEKQKYYDGLKNSKIFKIYKTDTNFLIIKFLPTLEKELRDSVEASTFSLSFPKEEANKYLLRITISDPAINKKVLSLLLRIDKRSR